jgi:competence ComEA-like helix-hairpin-helix protein
LRTTDTDRVLERSSIGALGLTAAGLALSALAFQPRAAPVEPTHLQVHAPARRLAPGPSASALRALRDGERIAINTAGAADLELLPGVGPKLAQRILEHRRERGPFARPEDLLAVKGIGPRTLERLAPLITVEPENGEPHSSNTNTTAAAAAK